MKSLRYEDVAVLILYWEEGYGDLEVLPEVDRLTDIFERRFGFVVQQGKLPSQGSPVQANAILAKFVQAHHGVNNLLIVYYAGHAAPGELGGTLRLFGLAILARRTLR